MRRRTLTTLLALALPLLASGCLAAAAGAGAGGLYFTTRGVGQVVEGDVEQVTGATRQAFSNLGVDYKGQKDSDEGKTREVYGAVDGDDVTVGLEPKTDVATKVEVSVRKNAVAWDKDMARRIVEEIQRLRQQG
ncbi:MAG TPA: DUF3568 family protein [Gemmatimonadota bacterium]|nr:DUF3568 family protein [Gemmatimonadota bacterium]